MKNMHLSIRSLRSRPTSEYPWSLRGESPSLHHWLLLHFKYHLDHGVRLVEISKKSDVSISVISRFVTEDHSAINLDNFNALGTYLGLSFVPSEDHSYYHRGVKATFLYFLGRDFGDTERDIRDVH